MSADRELRAERRMSDVEALMWTLEKDPHLSASIANLTILDRSPDPVRLRERMGRAVAAVPRLRQRVVPAPARLAPPEWRDDPDFDLGYHLREVALPPPGSMRQLLDMTSTIAHHPFDRTRPLWEFVVIHGLEGGRAAMVQKLHHTVTDGIGGIRMSEQFLDLERDAAEPIAPLRRAPASPTGGPVSGLVDTAAHNLRRGAGMVRRGAVAAAGAAVDPRRGLDLARGGVELGRSVVRQLAVTDPARSPLWSQRSLRRHLEVLSAPVDDAKRAAHRLGGSLNDLFVTAAAAGAGAYHRRAGVEVAELRMAMPVSTRGADRSAGGNAFAPSRLLVPVDRDPRELFAAVRDRLSTVRGERALGMAEGLAGFAGLLPTSLLVRAARQQVETVDFTTSNVRGAPFPLYVAGARIEATHPVGPLGGTAWNLTLMSYDGHLDMGLHVDAGAVSDPAALRSDIDAALVELLATRGRRQRGVG